MEFIFNPSSTDADVAKQLVDYMSYLNEQDPKVPLYKWNSYWYILKDNVWEKGRKTEPMELRKFITNEYKALYIHWQGKYNKMACVRHTTNTCKQFFKGRCDQCAEIYRKLGNHSYKNRIIKESKEHFYDSSLT